MASPGGYRKAINGTRQSIWDAHIDLYRHTGSFGWYSRASGQGKRLLQSPRDVPAGCSNYLYGDWEGGSWCLIGVGERLLMFEHAVYTVATPEACAAILGKMPARFPAAIALKCRSQNLGHPPVVLKSSL